MNTELFSAPGILRESNRGIEHISLMDDMFNNREINVVTEITSESCNSIIMQLITLDRIDPGKEITMYINSPGGEVTSGLCLLDTMKAIKSPIRAVNLGLAASMASLIFASADKREMMPHSEIMIHDPRIMQTGGSALDLQTISENLMRTRKIIAEILAKCTGKTVDEILELTSSDKYFTAEEAWEFGLCDKIIVSL